MCLVNNRWVSLLCATVGMAPRLVALTADGCLSRSKRISGNRWHADDSMFGPAGDEQG